MWTAVVGAAAITVAAARDASAYGVIFGALVASMSALTLMLFVLEQRFTRRGSDVSLGIAPDGTAATVINRAAWTTRMSAFAVWLCAAAPLAGAVAGFAESD
ncbi:MAG: hypothetical protein ACRDYU_09225 [Actinomycetes bacterium]